MTAAQSGPPRILRLAGRSPWAEDDTGRDEPPEGLPEIVIGPDVHRVCDELDEKLGPSDPLLYQRAHQLVTIVGADGKSRAVEGTPIIRALNSHALCTRVTRHVRLMSNKAPSAKAIELAEAAGKRAEWEKRPAQPAAALLNAFLNQPSYHHVRHLRGVTETPIFRSNGSIQQTPGYDEETGYLYLEPAEPFPEVPENPSPHDGMGAIDALREVVHDFPFARAEHESAWIAGVLTMLARPAIDGCVPLFAVDATTRGTGKSRLVDAATVIVRGQHCARTSLPKDDDEMRKRITSIVLDGDASVCVDNINAPLMLPSLESVLTSMVWKDRELGKNANVTAPHRTVWWATGNNLVLGGDIARRPLHIRHESSLENPEERTGFEHPDLLHWVLRERKRLVVAGLTLLRAYILASATYEGGLWGSFEEWSRLVCGAIVWAGGTSPLLARATQDPALDDAKRALFVLVDGLNRLCPIPFPGAPVKPLSAKAIVSALYPHRDRDEGPLVDGFDELRDVIEQETRCLPGKIPEARRLGKWLSQVRGRVVGGWCVQRHDGPNHSACWRAEPSGSSVAAAREASSEATRSEET